MMLRQTATLHLYERRAYELQHVPTCVYTNKIMDSKGFRNATNLPAIKGNTL